jgi:hypothetical protein
MHTKVEVLSPKSANLKEIKINLLTSLEIYLTSQTSNLNSYPVVTERRNNGLVGKSILPAPVYKY